MTLRQLASIARNNIVNGLKGVSNEAFSLEQLMSEILLESNTIITREIKAGTLPVANIAQRIDGIELVCDDIAGTCEVDSLVSAPHIQIPKLAQFMDPEEAIQYIGPMDNTKNFKVYVNNDYVYHDQTFTLKDRPYVWIKQSTNTAGFYDVFFFNLGKYNNLKFVSISARFENPYDLLKTPYSDQFITSEFFAPESVQTEALNNIQQRWITYYKQMAIPPLPNIQE